MQNIHTRSQRSLRKGMGQKLLEEVGWAGVSEWGRKKQEGKLMQRQKVIQVLGSVAAPGHRKTEWQAPALSCFSMFADVSFAAGVGTR